MAGKAQAQQRYMNHSRQYFGVHSGKNNKICCKITLYSAIMHYMEDLMMSNVTVQSRVNPELKALAENIFANMGMSTADAIRIFLQQSVNEGRLPFQPSTKVPNAKTLAAFAETEANKTHRTSLEELRSDMDL
jgi:DNA-damage-inducible protein J